MHGSSRSASPSAARARAFLDGPDDVDEEAWGRLEALVALAERERLYLDRTGLGCHRAEATPEWYDALDEARRSAVQARFWSAIAERVGASPAIFAHDLVNEPVPSEPTSDGLPGEPLGGFSYVQNLTRDPAGRTWQQPMRAWIRTMRAAIRAHDARHAITVGLLPFASYAEIADELDHVSVHVYPRAGMVDASLALLAALGASGTPVVVEETYPLETGGGGNRASRDRAKGSSRAWNQRRLPFV